MMASVQVFDTAAPLLRISQSAPESLQSSHQSSTGEVLEISQMNIRSKNIPVDVLFSSLRETNCDISDFTSSGISTAFNNAVNCIGGNSTK
jgi:hypothetical protein